jgi:hypothetical protein
MNQLTNLQKAGRLIRLLGWLSLIAVIGIVAAIAIPLIATGKGIGQAIPIILLSLLSLVIPIIHFWVGNSIKQNKKWAKIIGVIIGILNLLNFPIGTFIGIFILLYLYKGWNESETSN